MESPTKYTFDQAFDGGAKNRFDLELARLQNEIETTRTTSHAQGIEEGRNQMRGEIEAATQALAQQLIATAGQLMADHIALEMQVKQDMGRLALLVADKLAAGFAQYHSEDSICALIDQCLGSLSEQITLKIRVSADKRDQIDAHAQKAVEQQGLPGAVKVFADDSMQGLDCAIDWGNGSITRDQQKIEKQVQEAVHHFLGVTDEASPDTPDDQGSLSAAENGDA